MPYRYIYILYEYTLSVLLVTSVILVSFGNFHIDHL